MIAHIFKDKHKVSGTYFFLNLLVSFFYNFRLLVVPIALQLGVSNRQRTVPKPNPVLESAFKQHKSHCPDHKTILVSYNLGFGTTEPVFGVSKKRDSNESPKLQRPARKLKFRLWQVILSNKRITKAMIRLRGCAGWSAPFLFGFHAN